MRKNDWWVDVLLVAALVAVVLAIVFVATQLMWNWAADRQVRELLEEAQARSDLYRAASAPAVERPADAIVVYEPPASEEH